MNREAWYVLEDGSCGDPRDIITGSNGRLCHTDGRAVAYAPHGPRSRNVDPDEERGKISTADLKPETPKRGYKTREARAGK